MGSRSYIFNILHKDLHKKLHKEPLLPMSLILFAVILAYSFRLIGRGSFYPTLFSYLRSFIYIGLYAAWGISIRQRIVQKQVGQYLVGVSVLLILWFTFHIEEVMARMQALMRRNKVFCGLPFAQQNTLYSGSRLQ